MRRVKERFFLVGKDRTTWNQVKEEMLFLNRVFITFRLSNAK